MKYFRSGYGLAKAFMVCEQGEAITWADTCRFGRDTMHYLAATALITATASEIVIDGPRGTGIAGCLAGMAVFSEMGARINDRIAQDADPRV